MPSVYCNGCQDVWDDIANLSTNSSSFHELQLLIIIFSVCSVVVFFILILGIVLLFVSLRYNLTRKIKLKYKGLVNLEETKDTDEQEDKNLATEDEAPLLV